jgi:hypothetical protein
MAVGDSDGSGQARLAIFNIGRVLRGISFHMHTDLRASPFETADHARLSDQDILCCQAVGHD